MQELKLLNVYSHNNHKVAPFGDMEMPSMEMGLYCEGQDRKMEPRKRQMMHTSRVE